MIEILASITLSIGTLFVVLASVGLLRFPDVYGRLHAATKASTLGLAGMLLASALFFGSEGFNVAPEFLTLLFIFLTNPIGGHMLGRSAYLIGVPMSDKSIMDEMERAGEHADREHDQH